MQQNDEEDEELELIVQVYRDVLFEALIFGDRRRLTKLERIGLHFHQIIENFFKQKPHLRLDLSIHIHPRFLFFILTANNCLKI